MSKSDQMKLEQENVPLATPVESIGRAKNPAEAGTLNAVFETMRSFHVDLSRFRLIIFSKQSNSFHVSQSHGHLHRSYVSMLKLALTAELVPCDRECFDYCFCNF